MSKLWFNAFYEIVCAYWDSNNKSEVKHTHYECNLDKDGVLYFITVAPTNQEICGGPKDGKVYSAPFCFDISAFSAHEGIKVEKIAFCTRNFDENVSTELRIDGSYKNQTFLLDIRSKAPLKNEVDFLEKVNGYTDRPIKYEK